VEGSELWMECSRNFFGHDASIWGKFENFWPNTRHELVPLLSRLFSSPAAMIPSRTGSTLRRAAPKAARSVLARGAHKEVKFSNEGRAAMLAGVDTLAKAVSVTLGPKG
jgi:hypothetical protein